MGLDRLNAPFGARCFMTVLNWCKANPQIFISLNAPFGARCFMTIAGTKFTNDFRILS